jgi:DNA-binding winged helix-turn-helix (wHTH) protein/tetratricopeptide (TPR) repeat protein
MGERQAQIYEFGDFRLDAAKRLLLKRGGEAVPLTPKVFDTLLYLIENRGSVLTKDELMKALWPDTVVEENNLGQNISKLRNVLGESRGENRYILTVPGRGYRFVADVKTPAPRADASSDAAVKTLAVLPFRPLVAETRDASLEMGMADTLIARLSNIREVVVRPISSVRKYVELDQDPLAAGRDLGVESVLDGSIQRWGDHIRVTVRLMRVSGGASLWAAVFDEKFTDIFAVQDVISEKVAGALASQLSDEEKRRLTRRDTENAEAYQLYLKGRYYWWESAPETYRKSRDFFQRAVSADPSFALGYCGLNSYYGFGSAWGVLPPDEGWPKAERAITKALELDDRLAEAHTGMAALKLVYYRDWAGAEREAERAIELNPKFDEIHYFYSFYLAVMGRFDEAIAECRRALELDPLSFRINQHLGNCFYYARRYDEAIRQYAEALELDSHNVSVREFLGDAFEQKKMYGEAVAEWRRASALAGDDELAAVLGSAYAAGGFASAVRAAAQKRLARLNERVERGEYVPAVDFARAYVRLGRKEQAFSWLGKAAGERNVYALLMSSDPFYDGLRADPRFEDLLRRVGFAP